MENNGTQQNEEPDLKAAENTKASNESTLDSRAEKGSNENQTKNKDNDEPKAKEKSNEATPNETKDDDVLSQMSHLKLSEESESKKLEAFDIASVTKYMKTCKNIIFMVGAGISTCKQMNTNKIKYTESRYNFSDV